MFNFVGVMANNEVQTMTDANQQLGSGEEESARTSRPSWDEYFMDIAEKTAERSTCKRANVGAVLVRDKRIISTGYNGAPSGLPHCTEVGCLIRKVGSEEGSLEDHCHRTVHAEQNAIIQAALHGTSTKGATLYVTHQPCFVCAKMLINAGIDKIVFRKKYQDELSTQFLKQAGVELEVLARD